MIEVWLYRQLEIGYALISTAMAQTFMNLEHGLVLVFDPLDTDIARFVPFLIYKAKDDGWGLEKQAGMWALYDL